MWAEFYTHSFMHPWILYFYLHFRKLSLQNLLLDPKLQKVSMDTPEESMDTLK